METVLRAHAATYETAYGRSFEVRVAATDVALVGTIGYPLTISGGVGWTGDERSGAVVAGALEAEPGVSARGNAPGGEVPGMDGLREALLEPGTTPGSSATLRTTVALPGRWAAAAWGAQMLVVVNGASMGLSLWRTDGPDGWAVGSRVRPLLELVGRAAELDLDVAALTVTFRYVAASRSLFTGVDRFGPGERATLAGDGSPVRIDRPVRLDDVLGPRRGLAYDDVVDELGDRVTRLVRGEMSRSADGRIGLSGGRDSRLLAAAAVKAGLRPPATTGGPANSPDVTLARQVARLLDLDHDASADPVSGESPDQQAARWLTGGGGRAQPMTIERLSAWIRLSEGTAQVSMAWNARDLSRPPPPTEGPAGQTLSGLGGETHRGIWFPTTRDLERPGSARRGPDAVLDRWTGGPKLRRPVRDLLAAEIESGLEGLDDHSLSLSEWLARLHWRFRENWRGSDTLARADLVSWTWAPLMDLGVLRSSREAPAAHLASSRLVEDATVRLAPQLAGVPYDKRVIARPPDTLSRVIMQLGLRGPVQRVRSLISVRRRARPTSRSTALRALWEELYFGPGDHVWPALIAEQDLRRIVRDDPDDRLVKALATPELLFRDGR